MEMVGTGEGGIQEKSNEDGMGQEGKRALRGTFYPERHGICYSKSKRRVKGERMCKRKESSLRTQARKNASGMPEALPGICCRKVKEKGITVKIR